MHEVLALGCWSERATLGLSGGLSGGGEGADWQAELIAADGSEFDVFLKSASGQLEKQGRVRWSATGRHNVYNALSAIAAAQHVGVRPADAIAACADFVGVKRRMELIAAINDIHVYDDFAHHPTAIATTLEGLRAKVGAAPIVAVIEPRSNTMRLGVHLHKLAPATAAADRVIWYQPPGLDWSLSEVVADSATPALLSTDIDTLVAELTASLRGGEHVVIMSNGGFGGIHQKLAASLRARWPTG